jgi:hypothetical protein
MPALVAGIHVLLCFLTKGVDGRLTKDVDGRDEPGHDDGETGSYFPFSTPSAL